MIGSQELSQSYPSILATVAFLGTVVFGGCWLVNLYADPDEFGLVDPEYTVDDLAWFAAVEIRERQHEQGLDD